MNESLYLKDIGALTSMQGSLSRFAERTRESMQSIDTEIRRTIEWINERVGYWQGQVEKARKQVTRAQEAYRQCQASDQTSCKYEAQALSEAIEFLKKCNENLQTAQIWRVRIEKAENEFRSQSQKIGELLSSHTAKTRQALSGYATKYSEVQQAENYVGIAVIDSTSAESAFATPISWVDKGIQLISLDNLPNPEGISGSQDFEKVSETEMRSGIEKWLTMKTIIDSGVGNSSGYWGEVDRQQKIPYEEGFQRIYDSFYGQDCIRVNKAGDYMDIINGRHRIWLAKRMGIQDLPMQVVEKSKSDDLPTDKL